MKVVYLEDVRQRLRPAATERYYVEAVERLRIYCKRNGLTFREPTRAASNISVWSAGSVDVYLHIGSPVAEPKLVIPADDAWYAKEAIWDSEHPLLASVRWPSAKGKQRVGRVNGSLLKRLPHRQPERARPPRARPTKASATKPSATKRGKR